MTLVVFLFLFSISSYTQDTAIKDIEMVRIEGGNAVIGNSEGEQAEKPEHEVNLNTFYLSKYEITNAQYCRFLNEAGNQTEAGKPWIAIDGRHSKIEKSGENYQPKAGYDNHPVMEVSWYGAKVFCEWKGGRLPTEAEWEYAAKGGKSGGKYKFSGSDDPYEVAWFGNNSGGNSHPVGQKKPNQLGLYDMTGNAWEWCYDWFDPIYYKRSPDNNPKGPKDGKYKVLRGGGWASLGFSNLYNTVRVIANPNDSGIIGFRLCKEE